MTNVLLVGLAALLLVTLIAIAGRMFLLARARRRARPPGSVPGAVPGRPSNEHDAGGQTLPVENVQFTIYRPREVTPLRWSTLLAFVHLADRRVDEPEINDPVREVNRQAERLLGEQLATYTRLTVDGESAIPRSGELTIVPRMDDIEFNPAQCSFRWEQAVHRAEFSFRALGGAVPRVSRGHITVFWGAVIIGEIALSIHVVAEETAATRVADQARPYRRIFASYSHRDDQIVQQFETFGRSLGDDYLRDVRSLRAGEVWSERLEELIRTADVFQLFWSWNALRSSFVRQELEYALALEREHFVRPVYWEDPLPAVGDLPPARLRRIHFYRVAARAADDQTASAATQLGSAAATDEQAAPRVSRGTYKRLKSYAPALAVIAMAILAWPVIRQYGSMSDEPATPPSPGVSTPPNVETPPPPPDPSKPPAPSPPSGSAAPGKKGTGGTGKAPSDPSAKPVPPKAQTPGTAAPGPPPPAKSVTSDAQARAAIRDVLQRYRIANETLNFEALRQVWPGVPQNVATQFESVTALEMSFTAEPVFVDVQLSNGRAVVQVPVRITERRLGETRTRNAAVTITLSKVNAQNQWVIVDVNYKPRD